MEINILQQYFAHNSLLPFYLSWKIDPNNHAYNLCFSYSLQTQEEAILLSKKLQELISLKAYLRQTFSFEENNLKATIHEVLPAEINTIVIPSRELPQIEIKLIKRGHDLNHSSAIYFNIIQFSDSEHCVVLFNIHHIIMDGISLDSFIKDLNKLLREEHVVEESAEDYVNNLICEFSIEPQFGHNKFANYTRKLQELSEQINFPTNADETELHYVETLPDKIFNKLHHFSQSHRISVFNLLLLAQGIFLAKLFNEDFSLTYYPVNIRKNKYINGCFVNLMAFPLTMSNETSYLSLIQSFSKEISFLKSITRKKIDTSIAEEFLSFAESTLAFPNEIIIGDRCYQAKSYIQLANSRLSIKYRENKNKLHFSCDAKCSLLPEYLANSLLTHFFFYLDKLLSHPEFPIINTDLILSEERNLLASFNNMDVFYDENVTLLDLFGKIVIKHPNKTAIKASDGTLSYFELNLKAEQLATYLMESNLNPSQDKVAILIDNRLAMIVSILGVLKTGAAYIPIAPDTPSKRITYILEDSKIRFLVTLPVLVEKNIIKAKVIDIDQIPATTKKVTHKQSVDSRRLACVIYTSGTAGEPKGVLLSHKTLVNLSRYYIKEFELTSLSNCLKYAGFGFDASIIEIFPALLAGSTLHVIADDIKKDLTAIKHFFIENNIDFGFLPTQLAELFLESCGIDNSIKLKYLIVGGEKLHKYSPVNFYVVNAYGTTETSVHVTSFIIGKKATGLPNLPIGKPIDNVKCYVVDKHLNLLPIGAIGELVVGGEAPAEGYLNLPEMTAVKFIANPFQNQHEQSKGINTRLYRTGDQVRWLPEGNLDYIGRNDFQVKLRGHRIEISEIENKLTNHPKIFQSLVLAKNDSSNNKYLVAYYTANEVLNDFKLQDYLSPMLPDYMIPSAFIYLKNFPLTINGKLDRNLLPEPIIKSNNYVSSTNAHEELICSSFAKILNIEKIGIDDDFFRMGGTSIKTITLVSALQDKCNIKVSDVFNLKTPRKIAKNILFIDNNVKRQLDRIKQLYTSKSDKNFSDIAQKKLDNYQKDIENIILNKKPRTTANILLTGATGFLGCNLLQQLLRTTNHTIFLVVRAASNEEAINRVYNKYKYYFNEPLINKFKKRLYILAGDLEKDYLGLLKEIYQDLTIEINTIIHCAALTKHYGQQEQFYSANIQATINLLELSKLTSSKDFHYISTISVLNAGYIPNNDYYIATEEDTGDILEGCSNLYVKTKHEGEKIVVAYRQYGINSNIYRVGNLAFMACNHQFQENQEDNSFLYQLKALVNLGIIPQQLSNVEISFADYTAKAIVRLIDNLSINNEIYHVYNPHSYDLIRFFCHHPELSVKQIEFSYFLDFIHQSFNDPNYQKYIERFLLHKGWLDEYHYFQTRIEVKQNKTLFLLEQLNFKWPSRYKAASICDAALKDYLLGELVC
jgi:amino acid adenylation domain-containing protein/thioester reductase-like protein